MPKIVIGYDFTHLGELALEQAAMYGSKFPPVQLHAIAVLDGSLKSRGLIDEIDYRSAEAVRRELGRIIERVPRQYRMPSAEVFAHSAIGRADREILRLAEEVEADMIMVGTHGLSGFTRLMLGSVAESVMRHASCPVLVARPVSYESNTDDVPAPEPPDPSSSGPRTRPHTYSYRSGIAPRRPSNWPLY